MERLNQAPQSLLFALQNESAFVGDGLPFKEIPAEAHKYSQLLSAIRFIDENISQNLKVRDIATHVYMSESNFARLFRLVFNISTYQYIMKRKMDVSARLLAETNLSISSITYHTGFSDITSFSRSFKLFYKLSPTDYRSSLKIAAANS